MPSQIDRIIQSEAIPKGGITCRRTIWELIGGGEAIGRGPDRKTELVGEGQVEIILLVVQDGERRSIDLII